MLLETIKQANDIKEIRREDYGQLAQEIRDFLIRKISVTGGHLGSNLGTVELTMALHLALNLPEDKIVWDVGHQSYTHKILTGRGEGFDHLRQFHGLSGFPKRKESDCDVFDTGHSSTSVSAGLGLVKARDLKGESSTIVSVIGDGSMTGGMAYEALNEFYHYSERQQYVHLRECGRFFKISEQYQDSHRVSGPEGGHLQLSARHQVGRKHHQGHSQGKEQLQAARDPGNVL